MGRPNKNNYTHNRANSNRPNSLTIAQHDSTGGLKTLEITGTQMLYNFFLQLGMLFISVICDNAIMLLVNDMHA